VRRARRSLSAPPEDLGSFPSRMLAPTKRLWRIHRAERKPWWFCSDGDCRFDLPAPAGTCYLSEQALGSFVEVFRDITLIAEEAIAARRLSRLNVPRRMRLADCTSSRARTFGCTGEIHTTADYELTQRWAAAFAQQGFDGLWYLVRHDPSQREVGVALFGETGMAKGWPEPSTEPIGEELLAGVGKHFGIHILSRP
jgi:hypothetical protein